jgi:hypothetical protein
MVQRDDSDEPEEGVLEPDELDVERREEVDEIGDNRYIVSTDEDDDGGSPPQDATDPSAERRTQPPDDRTGPSDRSSGADPTPLAALDERYVVDVTAKVDGGVAETRIGSDSIVETFEETLLWYADRIDDSTPPEEVIRILLAESDLDVSLLD